MIERQFRPGQPPSTILTTVFVAKVDVGAGERHMMKPLRNAYTITESQHGWVFQADGNTTYDAIVSRQDLYLTLDEQRNGPLP